MDNFDDLLSSSSRALEDNPFANPFAQQRSGSPDPWSTFGQQSHNVGFQDEHYSSHFGNAFETHEPLHDEQEQHKEHETTDEYPKLDDALSVDNLHAESHSESPGFLESTPNDDDKEDDTPTIHNEETPKEREEAQEEEAQTPLEVSPTKTVEIPTPKETYEHRVAPNPTLSTFGSSDINHFSNPLDFSTPAFSQSFASLALGGESVSEWQSSSNTYATSTEIHKQEREDVVDDSAKEQPEEKETKDSDETKPSPGSQDQFLISVEDPQKVGDPIRPYILYTVFTKTTSPLFAKSSFSVLRRYSDFLWLYETLSLNNPGVIVPPVPEKSSFGRFSELFVQQRRLALEKCIQKIAAHPVLIKDADFKLFLESDNFALDIKHRKTEGGSGILTSISQTLAGPRFYEVDDWFDRKKSYLDGLELQLKGLVKAIDIVSKQRADLSVTIGEFAQAIGELSESDVNPHLKQCLAALTEVEKQSQSLQHVQAQEDAITLMSTAEEYSRVINSVRMAFESRIRCHGNWQNAESELRKVIQTQERTRNQQDRGHALAQRTEAERRVLDAKQEFEKCSRLIKEEVSRFEDERIHEFKLSLSSFLEGMVQRQKELISSWESYQDLLLKKPHNGAQAVESEPIASTTVA